MKKIKNQKGKKNETPQLQISAKQFETEREWRGGSFRFQSNWVIFAALAAITILTIAISIYCLSSGYFTIFQNLFYIPIIIACVYYTKRGFAFSVFIAGIYFLLIMLFTRDSAILLGALIRVLIFVLVAGLITYLSLMRKREAGEEFKSAKSLLDTVIDSSPFAMWISDREGMLIRTNRSLREILNLTDGQLIGKYNVLNDANLEKQGVMPMVRAVFEKHKPARFSIPWKASNVGDVDFKGGRDLFIDVSIFPILDNKDVLTNVVCQWADITERKRAEERLTESEKEYRSLFDNMQEGFQVIGFDWKYLLVNDAVVRQGKKKKEELLGRTMMETYPGIENTAMFAELKRCMEERVSHRMENEFAFPDNSKGWYELSFYAVPEGVAIFSQDITERKRALEETDMKGMLLDHSADSIIVHNLEGNILYVNQEAAELRGYSAEELLGKNIHNLVVPEHVKLIDSRIEDLKVNDVAKFESIHIRKDGTIFPIEVDVRLVDWHGQKLVLRAGRDITDRKKVDELKDQFLSTTSHELKSPLIPIKSQCQLLLDGDYGALNNEQKDAVKMIYKNEDHLERLVTDILDIAKARSNKLTLVFEKADIGEIANDVIENIKGQAKEKDITLSLEIAPKLPPVFVDYDRIIQVMNNLLTNALKNTSAKETVAVTVDKTEDSVRVSVRDTGIGMNKRTLEKIFTPFFQADSGLDRRQGGSGLGLSISKEIVEAHGGKIWGSSEGKNKGSTFTFTLPLKRKNITD